MKKLKSWEVIILKLKAVVTLKEGGSVWEHLKGFWGG